MRIAIVGTGAVGEACAHALVAADVARRLLLLNRTLDVADAIARDLRQARAWGRRLDTSIADLATAGSLCGYELLIVTLGPRLRGAQSRTDVAAQTATMLRDSGVVARLAEVANDERTCVLVVSNPVDLTVTWLQEQAGLAPARCFGLGTTVESARLSQHLASRLDVDASSAWVHVLGEHGPRMVVVGQGRLETLAAPEALRRAIDHATARTLADAATIREISETAGRAGAQRIRAAFAREWPEAPEAALEWLEQALAASLAPPATRFAIAAAVVEVARAIGADADRVMTLSSRPPAALGLPDVALSLPFAVRRGGLGRCVLHAVPPELHDVATSLRADYDQLQAGMARSPS